MKRGLFITLEGGEGAGKTVQVERLVRWLREQGRDVVETLEPGGTAEADALWAFFIENKGQNWPAVTQLFFMFTLRTLHVEQKILPALAEGKHVISARFTDSTRVYQGYAGGIPQDVIETVKKSAIGDFEPAITFYLDIDPLVGLARSERRANGRDTFEEKTIAFHQSLREGYLKLAARHPERFVVIDARQDIETIASEILERVLARV
ncbi:MAG: dTMP kinase [Micavibrio sp.]